MKKALDDLTLEEARFLFSYDPSTGIMRTRVAAHKGRWPAGRVLNTRNGQGYYVVWLGGKTDKRGYRLHRLAWLLSYGRWPEHEIDHINGNRADNRLENLREATASQNLTNKGPVRDGLKGAYRTAEGRWRSAIGRNPYTHLGVFETEEQAHQAYCAEARKRYGAFARFS